MTTSELAAFHRATLIVDGLTPLYVLEEPYTQAMFDGGVDCGLLSVASEATWDQTLERVERVLDRVARNPRLTLATTAAQVREAKRAGRIALVMVTQSAEMCDKEPKRVAILWRLGFRVLGLAYTFANLYGDGCGEPRDAGLTFLGRELIAAVNELPMMLDLSHAGHRTALEAAELARAPCLTHANAYAVEPNDRNHKDEVLRAIAGKGGVAGLCGLPRSVRAHAPTLADMMRHLDHLLAVMGEGHVGLGLDYVEGFKRAGTVLPVSRRNRTLRPDIFGSVDDFLNQDYPAGLETIDRLPNLTAAMAARGWSQPRMAGVLGESWLAAIERVSG